MSAPDASNPTYGRGSGERRWQTEERRPEHRGSLQSTSSLELLSTGNAPCNIPDFEDPRPRDFSKVLEEEGDFIDESQAARPLLAPTMAVRAQCTDNSGLSTLFVQGKTFSLAFSGGGVRAAAFQAGALWTLAEEGLLKYVDYWVAVSGGGYIAASYISHILDDELGDDEDLDSFYRRVVATTLVRFQKNAGNFIRDPAHPCSAEDQCPRWMDGLSAVMNLCMALLLNPFLLFILLILPTGEAIHALYAREMREVWCTGNVIIFENSYIGHPTVVILQRMWQVLFVCSFICFISGKTVASWQEGKNELRYLLVRSLTAVCIRGAILLFVMWSIVLIVPNVQEFAYGESAGQELCIPYVKALREGHVPHSFNCANVRGGSSWADSYTINETFDGNYDFPPMPPVQSAALVKVIAAVFSLAVMFLALWPVAPSLFTQLVVIVGPLAIVSFLVAYVQWRVYSPVTAQRAVFYFRINEESWYYFMMFVVPGVWTLVMFFMPELKSSWHNYYKRSLQSLAFKGGKDRPFKDQTEQPLLPFVIFTGTVNDFRAPGKEGTIDEISFSPLHMGSDATGYVRMPKFMTLAMCTALTGAGCLDAIAVSMTDDIRYRFWLELFDLTWGNYVLFLPTDKGWVPWVTKWFGETVARRAKESRALDWMLHRVPASGIFFVVSALFLGSLLFSSSGDENECGLSMTCLQASLWLLAFVMAASHFTFLNRLRFLTFSPMIRHYHRLSMWTSEDRKPPGALYVTDGGVQDCTGLRQLFRRRRPRILLALAPADPQDQLGVLRTTLQTCTKDRLAFFFNPQDPRIPYEVLLDEFREDKEKLFLHIGVLYPGDEVAGSLVVIKNRLPPSWTEDDACRFNIEPLMTEEEVRGEPYAQRRKLDADDPLSLLHPEDLGGFICCDCCHRRGYNCGAKFPSGGPLNYMVCTPQFANNLCRLGRALALPAIKELMRTEEEPVANSGREWREALLENRTRSVTGSDALFRSAVG